MLIIFINYKQQQEVNELKINFLIFYIIFLLLYNSSLINKSAKYPSLYFEFA